MITMMRVDAWSRRWAPGVCCSVDGRWRFRFSARLLLSAFPNGVPVKLTTLVEVQLNFVVQDFGVGEPGVQRLDNPTHEHTVVRAVQQRVAPPARRGDDAPPAAVGERELALVVPAAPHHAPVLEHDHGAIESDSDAHRLPPAPVGQVALAVVVVPTGDHVTVVEEEEHVVSAGGD